MAEPTIICPKCKNEIKLTESLAAPLIESTRLDYEQRLAQKDLDIASRENQSATGRRRSPEQKTPSKIRSWKGSRENEPRSAPKKPRRQNSPWAPI